MPPPPYAEAEVARSLSASSRTAGGVARRRNSDGVTPKALRKCAVKWLWLGNQRQINLDVFSRCDATGLLMRTAR